MKKIQIAMGASVRMEFEGVDRSQSATFIGMEEGQYLILRLPSGTGLTDHLYEGKVVVVKFVNQGKVYGFKSTVMACLYKKGLIAVFIQYPMAVETFQLRASDRVECFVPSRVRVRGRDMSGFVLDVSPQGCRFGSAVADNSGVVEPAINDSVVLFLALLGVKGSQEISCVVKSFNKSNQIRFLGLMFQDISETVHSSLEKYVEQVTSFRKQVNI